VTGETGEQAVAATGATPAAERKANPTVRFLLEVGPLGAFFVGYVGWNLMVATALLMVAISVSLFFSIRLEKRVPLMPLVTAAMVLIFGGLTLILQDEIFIKMKPTIVNGLFALALFTGHVLNRPLLRPLFGPVFELDDDGWRKLSLRWAFFFVFLGALNEVIWRNFSTDFWVNFKVFGNFPLTLIFAMLQVPLINRHATGETRAKLER